MTRPVIVLRPQPGCAQTVAAARTLSLEAIAAPLFAMEPVPWESPRTAGLDGILAGSGNAFRLGGPGLAGLRALPVHAVGEGTASAAREAGFQIASVGGGGLQTVVDALPSPAHWLRLAGEDRTQIACPPGMRLTERIVYRAMPLSLTDQAAVALAGDGVALLHSGNAARSFAAECDRLKLDRGRIALAALAPAIGAAAGSGWREVRSPTRLSDAALLALARDICQ